MTYAIAVFTRLGNAVWVPPITGICGFERQAVNDEPPDDTQISDLTFHDLTLLMISFEATHSLIKNLLTPENGSFYLIVRYEKSSVMDA